MMRPGKISEAVYKRLFLNGIAEKNTQKICQSAGIGVDACVHRAIGGVCPVTSAATVTGITKKIGVFALYRAINSLAAMGAIGKSIWVSFLFPDWFLESDLKGEIEQLRDAAAELKTEVAGIYAESVTGLLKPMITISAYGETGEKEWVTPRQIKAGMDIVMTKDAGTEGAVMLAFEREEELLKRFSPAFVEQIQRMFDRISAVKEAEAAVRYGVKAMHAVGEGGVFGALWELAEAAGLGLEVKVREIPIRQETVEVCEFFQVNPYQIPSAGSLLIVTEEGHRLAEEFTQRGFCAAVIGRITEGKERVLFQEEEKRYLEPPKMNELLKGLTENKVGG